MSKKALYIIGIVLSIVIGSILNYIINCNKHSTLTTNFTKNSFKISDNSTDFNIDVADNFNFLKSNSSIIKPISNDVLDAILKLKTQLLKNPSQIVTISGFFKSDEKNNTNFTNLGLARANSMKDYLVSLGLSANQINTTSTLNNAIKSNNTNTLFGPLSFGLSNNSDVTKTKLSNADKEKYKKLKGTSFDINFNTGKSFTALTTAQKTKLIAFSKAVTALGLKIYIEGHTDSVGSNAFNKVLGQKRADFVKNLFLQNGSLDNQIVTLSKGETKPIASNNTSNGRSKNRRTVIIIN